MKRWKHSSSKDHADVCRAADYACDAQGKRFWAWTAGTIDSYGNQINYSLIAYSASGQKLGTYQINTCSNAIANQMSFTICSALATSDQYFGGRRLAVMDQLGSAGTYYPWGEAKGTTNPQDVWSYATYWRDSVSGLDYANQRYYANAYGRFMTPDPYMASGGPSDPQSWNRYAYTRGDPVNRFDPVGLDDCPAGQGVPGPNGDGWICPEDPVGQGPGGGGGGYSPQTQKGMRGVPLSPAPMEIRNTYNRMIAAITAALNTLYNYPNCDALFNIGGQGPDPTELLNSILSDTNSQAYFTETYLTPGVTSNGSTGIANAVTAPTTWSVVNGDLVNTGHYGQVYVAFNYNPSAPFNSGSVGDNMTTVLHELGHVYEDLYGLGSTLLVNDTNSNGTPIAAASAYNDNLVKANCPPPGH